MILKNRIACRICLSASADVRFYHLKAFQLKSYYEEMINKVLTTDDNLLHFFCYQCSAMLQKYNSFRELCIKSQETLKKLTTQSLNISFEATLKWEQYNNKIHPSIKKLDSTAKLGYFEYEENDITIDESFDDPLVNNLMEYANSPNPYYDSEENFESKPVVDTSISTVSDVKHNTLSNRKIAKRNSNGTRKKSKIVKHLDPRKWKIVILSNEEALKEFNERIQKQDFKKNKLICEHCQRAFVNMKWLNKHMDCHSEANGKYVCFCCKKRYNAKYKLNLHLRLHLVKYHCLQCPQVFCAKNNTTQHEKFHEGFQYACPLCDIKFQQKSTFYGHLRIIHRSSHLCQFCGESFVNQSGLLLHKKRAHKSNSNDTGGTVTYCEQCDIMFENPRAFREHKRNSAKHITEDEDVLGERKKLLKYKPQRYECDKCDEQFSSKPLYNRHMERAHNMPKQEPNPRTVCEICGATVRASNLPMHMFVHKGKRFPCPDCDKVYNHLGNMKRHRRLHKDSKPYPCELCGKKFTDRTCVKLHVRTVHLKQPHPPRNRTRMKFASLGKRDE